MSDNTKKDEKDERDRNYTIVLPLKIDSSNSYKLFSRIGLKSYSAFLDTSTLHEFLIITPAQDVETVTNLASLHSALPIRVVAEEQFLSPGLTAPGWYKQQLLKMLAGRIVSTSIYLVVDADQYLTKRLGYEDLVVREEHDSGETVKYKYNTEPYQTINSPDYSVNSNWWMQSLKVMGMSKDVVEGKTDLMSVTPEIFVKEYINNLTREIEEKYGSGYQQYLCNEGFTEFTLYYLYILVNNLQHHYTSSGCVLWKHEHSRNALKCMSETELVAVITDSFNSPSPYFSVIQGYLPLPITHRVISTALRHLPYEAIFLTASCLNPNRSQSFTSDERLEQTLSTVRSAKEKCPNSFCLLIEGSVLRNDQKERLSEYFDHILEFGEDDEVKRYVTDKRNIGHGETKLLEKASEYILTQNIQSERVFKLGARYQLNERFDINNFSKDKYTFRAHHDSSVGSNVYTTGLFSIPRDRLDEFRRFTITGQNVLSTSASMVEKMYEMMIPKENVHLIDVLGLEGMLSYNKVLFSV